MKPPKGITLKSAKYIKDCTFSFTFSDGKISVVDFKPIIAYNVSLVKFLDQSKFEKIIIDTKTGDIHWGKDYDMCFHIDAYYGETSVHPKQKGGRKKLADKKVLVRLYVLESKINANGGMEASQEKATEFLNAAAPSNK